jgi:hypothetical protein
MEKMMEVSESWIESVLQMLPNAGCPFCGSGWLVKEPNTETPKSILIGRTGCEDCNQWVLPVRIVNKR